VRYLAIDYGLKRTGLAICDNSETVVSPLKVIQSREKLLEKIPEIIEAENVQAVVIGMPLNMDNSQGSQAEIVLKFAERLKTRLQIPVHFQDERLSSFGAEQKFASAGFTKKQKTRRLDALAAAEILQAFLDSKHNC